MTGVILIMTTIVAGTFNKFHVGHQKLLKAAVDTGKFVKVGVMSDGYVETHNHFCVPYDIRVERISGYLMSLNANFSIMRLDNSLGDSVTNPEYDAIVVSPETEDGAKTLNMARAINGLPEMKIIVVPHVLDESGQIVSSTRINKGDIDAQGRFRNRTEIIILGTSGGITSPNRHSAGILISHGRERILLDCGQDTSKQILAEKIPCDEIDAIFISHAHVDHFIGLPMLVNHHMMMLGRQKPLKIYYPSNADRFIRPFFESYEIPLPFKVELEMMDDETKYNGKRMNLRPFYVEHSIYKAMGFKVEDIIGNRIVYSGDTMKSDKVVDAALNADVLIHEATYASEHDGPLHGHSKVSDALAVAVEANVESLYLTHISMKYHTHMGSYLSSYDLKNSGNVKVFVAEDLMKVRL
jgi:ribonuclease BN (tRNA processing enzyme)/phosphopantetheine adenylyltransferase